MHGVVKPRVAVPRGSVRPSIIRSLNRATQVPCIDDIGIIIGIGLGIWQTRIIGAVSGQPPKTGPTEHVNADQVSGIVADDGTAWVHQNVLAIASQFSSSINWLGHVNLGRRDTDTGPWIDLDRKRCSWWWVRV